MVAIAGAIIGQRTGDFDPSTFCDSYQEALQQLIEAKMKGLAIEPRAASTPPPVIDLMATLKRSLVAASPSEPTRYRIYASRHCCRRYPAVENQIRNPQRSRVPPSPRNGAERRDHGAASQSVADDQTGMNASRRISQQMR
jgi:DNA end-binding protein Ku